jgi:RNA polymerase sigma-70 factor, ECF subfamily
MMADPARDLLALQRLQSGDEAALAELYDRYSALLYGVALRILHHPPEAEDALQEAWVQVWNQCSHYDARRGSVPAWLVTIARTRALDRLRRNASRGRVELQAAPATDAADPVDAAAHGKLRDTLARALAALDPKQRQVLEIAYFEGLSQSQIAARLGAPLGSVKYWARQGLLHLKNLVPRDEWV